MWATFKLWLAKKLCPQMARDQEKYNKIVFDIKSEIRWIEYDFPILADAMNRIIQKDYNYWRNLDAMPKMELEEDISRFRDYLRNKYKVN